MNYLQDLDNLLISDKQHCWFKHGGLVIDPDDGTSMSFDEFAEENGAAGRLHHLPPLVMGGRLISQRIPIRPIQVDTLTDKL